MTGKWMEFSVLVQRWTFGNDGIILSVGKESLMSTKKIPVLAIIGCLALAMLASTPQLSKKISMFGYKSEAAGIKLIVDAEIARLRGGEKYIPLVIWLGHGEKRTIRVGRESFTLVDPGGNSYALPAHDEVVKEYGAGLMSFDYDLARKMNDYGSMDFLSSKHMRKVVFFPNPSSGAVMYDNAELPNRSYIKTMLYFPNKAGKSGGDYVLTYEDKKSGDKVSTVFKVEWMK